MISIIIPSYRRQNLIETEVSQLVNYFRNNGIVYDLIIVDDGSDEWEEAKRQCELLGGTFFRLAQNEGKGAAVRHGILQAKGKYVLYTDSDIPFTFETVHTFIKEMENGSPMVIGDRSLSESDYQYQNNNRKLASRLFTFFVRAFFFKGYPDTQCGLKGFSKDVAYSLFQNSRLKSFAFDVEIIRLAIKKGVPIKKMAVEKRSIDPEEVSTVMFTRHGHKIFLELIRLVFKG